MRRNVIVTVAICVLILLLFSMPVSATSEKVIYSFTGGLDGSQPSADLIADGQGNLYGTTSRGGVSGFGTVFELTRVDKGWAEKVLYSFTGGVDGGGPFAGLTFDAAGNLFGTTAGGGSNNDSGTVFELSPNGKGGWTESVLYSFSFLGDSGQFTTADLIFDSQGNLYGVAEIGGIENGSSCDENKCGTIFELVPQLDGTWQEKTLYQFESTPDGALPSTGLIFDGQGNLHGMTRFGGNTSVCRFSQGYSGCGTVYSLAPKPDGTWTETVDYNFARGLGRAVNPSGGFIQGANGTIYATSVAGGNGFGTLFELKRYRGAWTQHVLYRFLFASDGGTPIGKIVTGATGNLYGVTPGGGAGKVGVVFELKHVAQNTWHERVLHAFTGGADGSVPKAGVTELNGRIYGTTYSGGGGTACQSGCGTVYEVEP